MLSTGAASVTTTVVVEDPLLEEEDTLGLDDIAVDEARNLRLSAAVCETNTRAYRKVIHQLPGQ